MTSLSPFVSRNSTTHIRGACPASQPARSDGPSSPAGRPSRHGHDWAGGAPEESRSSSSGASTAGESKYYPTTPFHTSSSSLARGFVAGPACGRLSSVTFARVQPKPGSDPQQLGSASTRLAATTDQGRCMGFLQKLGTTMCTVCSPVPDEACACCHETVAV